MTLEGKIKKLLELCEQNNFTRTELIAAFQEQTGESISRVTLCRYIKQGKLSVHQVVVKGVGFNIVKPTTAVDANGNLYQSPKDHLRRLAEENNYTRQQLFEAFAQQSGIIIIYKHKNNPPLPQGTPTVREDTLYKWYNASDLQEMIVKEVGFNIVKPKDAKDANANLYQSPQDHLRRLAEDNFYTTRQQLYEAFARQFGLKIIYGYKDYPPLPEGTLTVNETTLRKWCRPLDLQNVVVKGVGFDIIKPKDAKDVDGNLYQSPKDHLLRLAEGNSYTRQQLYEVFARQFGSKIIYGYKDNPPLPKGILTVAEDTLYGWCRDLGIYPLVQVDHDAQGRVTRIHGHAVMKPEQPGWMLVEDIVIRCIDQNAFTSFAETVTYFDHLGLRSSPSQSYTYTGLRNILDCIGCERVNGVIIAPTNTKNKKIIWTYYQKAQFDKLLNIYQQTKWRIVQLFNLYPLFTSWEQFNTLFHQQYPNAKEDGTPYHPDYLPRLARQTLGVKEVVIKSQQHLGLVPPTNTTYLTIKETLLQILHQETILNQKHLHRRFESITGIKVSKGFINKFCKANDIVSDVDTTTGRKRLQQVKKADADTNLSSKVKKKDKDKLTDAQNSSSGSNSGPQNSVHQNPHSESPHALEKDVEKLTQSKYTKVVPTDPVKRLEQHNKLVQKLRDIQRRHGLDEEQFRKLYELVTSPYLNPHPKKKMIKEILTRKAEKEVDKQSKIFEVFTPDSPSQQKSGVPLPTGTVWLPSDPELYVSDYHHHDVKQPDRPNDSVPAAPAELKPVTPDAPSQKPFYQYDSIQEAVTFFTVFADAMVKDSGIYRALYNPNITKMTKEIQHKGIHKATFDLAKKMHQQPSASSSANTIRNVANNQAAKSRFSNPSMEAKFDKLKRSLQNTASQSPKKINLQDASRQAASPAASKTGIYRGSASGGSPNWRGTIFSGWNAPRCK